MAGGLRVRQHRAATTRHPVTGAHVWFSQVDQWHPAGLGDSTAAELAELLLAGELPMTVTYADGGPIPTDVVTHVRDTAWRHAVDIDWHAGDVAVIDNVLVAHGRRPFTGPRRVLVAMSG